MKDDKLKKEVNELLDLIDNKCFMLKEKYYAILELKNIILQKSNVIK